MKSYLSNINYSAVFPGYQLLAAYDVGFILNLRRAGQSINHFNLVFTIHKNWCAYTRKFAFLSGGLSILIIHFCMNIIPNILKYVNILKK